MSIDSHCSSMLAELSSSLSELSCCASVANTTDTSPGSVSTSPSKSRVNSTAAAPPACPLALPVPAHAGGLASLIGLAPLLGPFSAEAFAPAAAYQPVLQLLGPLLVEFDQGVRRRRAVVDTIDQPGQESREPRVHRSLAALRSLSHLCFEPRDCVGDRACPICSAGGVESCIIVSG